MGGRAERGVIIPAEHTLRTPDPSPDSVLTKPGDEDALFWFAQIDQLVRVVKPLLA